MAKSSYRVLEHNGVYHIDRWNHKSQHWELEWFDFETAEAADAFIDKIVLEEQQQSKSV